MVTNRKVTIETLTKLGARKLAELQDMLHALEGSLSELRVGREGSAGGGGFE